MSPDFACVHLLNHAVLRVAGWPIESLAPFAAPELAAQAAALDAAAQAIHDRGSALSEALYGAIPFLSNRAARAYVLAVRRHVHGGVSPLPAVPEDVAAACAAVPGLSALLEQERAAREALGQQAAAFAADHDRELERQRSALRAAAAEEPFLRGLAIANPPVFLRWRDDGAGQEGTTRRARRLETTVFHYLCRAAGRPTPSGAWAGVSTVTPAETASVGVAIAPSPPRYLARPNLLPFAVMLRWLAAQPRYRRGDLFRLNPTLHQDGAGYRYERDDGSGPPRHEALPANAVTDTVARYFASGETLPVAPLLDALALAGGATDVRATLQRVIDSLIDRDLLRPDLDLPGAAADAWDALESVVPRLAERDRATWQRTLTRLRVLCDQLADRFESLTADAVNDLRASIEQAVQTLWSEYGLAGSPPGPALFLDMAAPVSATWNSAQIAVTQAAVRNLFAFHAADGGAELYRLTALREVAAACEDGAAVPLLPLIAAFDRARAPDGATPRDPADAEIGRAYGTDTRRGIFKRFPPDPSLDAEVAAQDTRWQALLEASHTEAAATLPCPAVETVPSPGFGGALLLPLTGGVTIWLGQGRPQPALFAGRFAPLLGDSVAGRQLFAALRSASDGASAPDTKPAEVVGRDPVNPNAALRPAFTGETLDPHAPPPNGLREVSVQFDRKQRPWLYRAGAACPGLPVYNSGAAIGQWDGCSRLLLLLAFGHGWEFLSFGFPRLPAEGERWHHLPRLLLSGGAVLSAERWTPAGEAAAAIAALSGAERYRAWCAWAKKAGLPPLVYVRSGSEAAELLLPTDSPLAIRCLFDTAPAGSAIVFHELPGDPSDWPVRDAAGRHYAAELGMTWYAQGYGADAPGSKAST